MSYFDDIKSIQDIKRETKRWNRDASVGNSKKWLRNFLNDDCIIEFIPNDVLIQMYRDFLYKFEVRCAEIIEEKTGEKKILKGEKVVTRTDFKHIGKGRIAYVNKVVRLDDDTFGQGWYQYYIGKSIGTEENDIAYGFELLPFVS